VVNHKRARLCFPPPPPFFCVRKRFFFLPSPPQVRSERAAFFFFHPGYGPERKHNSGFFFSPSVDAAENKPSPSARRKDGLLPVFFFPFFSFPPSSFLTTGAISVPLFFFPPSPLAPHSTPDAQRGVSPFPFFFSPPPPNIFAKKGWERPALIFPSLRSGPRPIADEIPPFFFFPPPPPRRHLKGDAHTSSPLTIKKAGPADAVSPPPTFSPHLLFLTRYAKHSPPFFFLPSFYHGKVRSRGHLFFPSLFPLIRSDEISTSPPPPPGGGGGKKGGGGGGGFFPPPPFPPEHIGQ